MRFLGIGQYNSLGDMYWRLMQAGHEVRVFVSDEASRGIFAGMIHRTRDWIADLEWIRAAGPEGALIFETATQGKIQDVLRARGFQVIGGSAYGDRLENERSFGQSELREIDLQTAAVHEFENFDTGLRFLEEHPDRYVFKFDGGEAASTRNYVGELDDGSDVRAVLQMEQSRSSGGLSRFVLMKHVSGVEVGVGAYFNGERFLSPVVLDWEHKRFFPGDLGELTGEMGTLVTYRGGDKLFNHSLAKMAAKLAAHNHCGYINLNMIINDEGVWPLEFTCRFGYPGFAICDELHPAGWGPLLSQLATRRGTEVSTRAGYALGVVLSVPPFPYELGYAELSRGVPIFFQADLSVEDRGGLHYGEVGLQGRQLVTAGSLGYVMVATGWGNGAGAAHQAAYALARKVVVPKLRYRNDIGRRFIQHDHAALQSWGWMPLDR